MSFQPLHGLITVILDPRETKTKGGVAIPDDAYVDILVTGTVRAVGLGGMLETGVRDRPDLQPGQKVMIAQQRDPRTNRIVPFPTVLDDGVLCVIVNHRDIWGTITDKQLLN